MSDEIKKLVAVKAVDLYISSNMLIGLGTGSTTNFAIEYISEKLLKNQIQNIQCVPTSENTKTLALKHNIPLTTLESVPYLDVAIDGADEVDQNLNLIKGRGAALLREKMIEEHAKKFIVIVDDSKLQFNGLGLTGALPVEVTKFEHEHIRKKLLSLDSVQFCEAKLRLKNNQPLETDNQNYIIDLFFKQPITNLEKLAAEIRNVVGVVEHGIFLNMASVCLVGDSNGNVKIIEASK